MYKQYNRKLVIVDILPWPYFDSAAMAALLCTLFRGTNNKS